MLKPGEVHVWLVRLRGETAALRRECSHQALRAILETVTGAPVEFAVAEKGKPYLPGAPEVRFNLAHSHELALVAVALGVDVGVDIERLRPLLSPQGRLPIANPVLCFHFLHFLNDVRIIIQYFFDEFLILRGYIRPA